MKLITQIWSALKSRRAAKGVINVSILATSYTVTLALSAIATALFHINYVPDASISLPLYLQYGQGVNPFSLIALEDRLPRINQDYDISISLLLPVSPKNLELGNFMIETLVISSDSNLDNLDVLPAFQDVPVSSSSLATSVPRESLLLRSRRPSLVPYRDPLVAMIRRLVFLPFYVITGDGSWMIIETRVAEKVKFSTTEKLPKLIFVEVQAGQSIQIYSASVKLVARMSGLRYLMYHYRTICYIALTGLFWGASMAFTTTTWVIWIAISDLSQQSDDDLHSENRRGPRRLKGTSQETTDRQQINAQLKTDSGEDELDLDDDDFDLDAKPEKFDNEMIPSAKFEGEVADGVPKDNAEATETDVKGKIEPYELDSFLDDQLVISDEEKSIKQEEDSEDGLDNVQTTGSSSGWRGHQDSLSVRRRQSREMDK